VFCSKFDRLEADDLTLNQIPEEKTHIKEERCPVFETELGFAEHYDVVAYLQKQGVSIAK
jgi:hypothetical protein